MKLSAEEKAFTEVITVRMRQLQQDASFLAQIDREIQEAGDEKGYIEMTGREAIKTIKSNNEMVDHAEECRRHKKHNP